MTATEMHVFHDGLAAVAAALRVRRVSKIAMKDGSPIPADMTSADAEAEGAREVVPARFTDPERSPLKAQVANGGASHDFRL